MPELNKIFAAPLESVQRPKSNVDRFPTIGAHLIDDHTPAYAKTEPPDTEPDCGSADPLGDDCAERHSAWGGLDLSDESAPPTPRFSWFSLVVTLALIAAGYLWAEHKCLITAWSVLLVCALALLGVAIAS